MTNQCGDVMVTLHSAVVHLQESLARHHTETKESFSQIQETLSRHHKETMEDVSRVAEILAAVF